MRIISGTARGTKLFTLTGDNTRPTLDRVKESLFNIINRKIYEAKVLDLFAGSGAIGIEFLSRRAKQVYFCDKSSKAVAMIEKNLEKTKLKEKAIVYEKDGLKLAIKEIENGDNLIEIETEKDNPELNSIDKLKEKISELQIPVDTNDYFIKKAEIELKKFL